MIVTRIDPYRLIAFQALINAGASQTQVQNTLRIKRRSYFYYLAELQRIRDVGATLDDLADDGPDDA